MSKYISDNGIGRHPCPFYGFANVSRLFVDQEGNQCPLMGGYTPCQMEMRGDAPNWNNCPFNNDENKEVLTDVEHNFRICPREMWPKGETRWSGISFSEWKERLMSQ